MNYKNTKVCNITRWRFRIDSINVEEPINLKEIIYSTKLQGKAVQMSFSNTRKLIHIYYTEEKEESVVVENAVSY
jgi:hypothetical protein